jgi:DNA-binding CsgD family transcriptional regulator
LATLHELHVQTVLVSGLRSTLPAASTNRALRLIDHHGIELYATPTWPAKSDLPAKACQQVRLEPDFVLAPGGTIEYFECDIHPPTSSAGLHPSIVRQLTPRESDIVRLTLAGYPTISIARRLNLSVGTVKNHRTRIFRKLDITTERELFLIQRDFTPPIAQATKI